MKSFALRACLFLAAATFVVAGLALFVCSFLPFELLKHNLDALASAFNLTNSRSATFLTRSFYEQLVARCWPIGVALIIGGGILHACTKRIQRHVGDVLTQFFSFSKELLRDVGEAVKREDRIHLGALLSLLLLAVAARLYLLFQPMRYDEAWTFTAYVAKPLLIGLSDYSTPNQHIFHSLLVRLSYLLFGNQPWAIRLPALLTGVSLVPATYAVARIYYNKYAALLAAGLAASSSHLISYSTNARGYTLVSLVFLLTLALAPYLIKSENTAAWLLFAVLSALGFYTIPIMLYPFGVVLTWLLLSIIFHDNGPRRGRLLVNLLISLAVTTVLTFGLYLPVFVVSGFGAVTSNRFVAPLAWSQFVTQFPASLYLTWGMWNWWLGWVKPVLVIGFFASLFFHRRLAAYHVPVWGAAVVWLAPILLIQRVAPFERVWMFLLPLYLTLASSGLIHLLKTVGLKATNYKSAVFAVAVVGLSGVLCLNVVRAMSGHYLSAHYLSETDTFRDAQAITIFLKDHLQPGDKVLSAAPSTTILKYYFMVYRVPVEKLVVDPDAHQRIIVVVDEFKGQTLRSVLKLLSEREVSDTELSRAKVIKHYESATLYEISGVRSDRVAQAGIAQKNSCGSRYHSKLFS